MGTCSKRLKIFFITFLGVFFLWAGAPRAAAQEIDAAGVDVVLVIDSSGSMRYNDRNRVVPDAAVAFMERLGGENAASRVGVVAFSGIIKRSLPLAPASSADEQEALRSSLARLVYNGYTDIGLAMREAEALLNGGDTGNARAVVLFTDGMFEIGPAQTNRSEEGSRQDVADVLDRLGGGTPVYTVGLNDNGTVEVPYLEGIAAQTGAQSYVTDNAEALPGIFDEICGLIGGSAAPENIPGDTGERVEPATATESALNPIAPPENTPSPTPESVESPPSPTPETAESTPSPMPESVESTPSPTPETAESTPSPTPETAESTPSPTSESVESTPSPTPETAENLVGPTLEPEEPAADPTADPNLLTEDGASNTDVNNIDAADINDNASDRPENAEPAGSWASALLTGLLIAATTAGTAAACVLVYVFFLRGHNKAAAFSGQMSIRAVLADGEQSRETVVDLNGLTHKTELAGLLDGSLRGQISADMEGITLSPARYEGRAALRVSHKRLCEISDDENVIQIHKSFIWPCGRRLVFSAAEPEDLSRWEITYSRSN